MRHTLAILVLSVFPLIHLAEAETVDVDLKKSISRAMQLMAKRRAVFSRKDPAVSALDYSGVWYGRYTFLPAASSCTPALRAINFRHVLSHSGRMASLSTSHDGSFSGRSNRAGTELFFYKDANSYTGRITIAIAYGSLSSSGTKARSAYAVRHRISGCIYAFGANASK